MFARSDSFKGEGFNLNGIVHHPDGYLLVAKYNSGEIFRINTRKNPGTVHRVKLSAPVTGADGSVLRGRDRISVVQTWVPTRCWMWCRPTAGNLPRCSPHAKAPAPTRLPALWWAKTCMC